MHTVITSGVTESCRGRGGGVTESCKCAATEPCRGVTESCRGPLSPAEGSLSPAEGSLSPAEGSLSPRGHSDQGVGGLLNPLTLYLLHLDVSIARNGW